MSHFILSAFFFVLLILSSGYASAQETLELPTPKEDEEVLNYSQRAFNAILEETKKNVIALEDGDPNTKVNPAYKALVEEYIGERDALAEEGFETVELLPPTLLVTNVGSSLSAGSEFTSTTVTAVFSVKTSSNIGYFQFVVAVLQLEVAEEYDGNNDVRTLTPTFKGLKEISVKDSSAE